MHNVMVKKAASEQCDDNTATQAPQTEWCGLWAAAGYTAKPGDIFYVPSV